MKTKGRLKFLLVAFSILLLMLFSVSCKEEAPTAPAAPAGSTDKTAGSLDTSFDPGTGANGLIGAVAIQTDGKIIIGAGFTSYNGVNRNRIARINSDGSLDTGFKVDDFGIAWPDGFVRAIAIQSDGKIIIGGSFIGFIARLNTNGTVDTSFNNCGTGPFDSIQSIAIQNDGKIIIGGDFTSYNGTVRNRIARLNSDGTLDMTFDPGIGADETVNTITIQSDGKIIIGGGFTSYNGTVRNRIARLNSDGSLDTGFNPGTGANGAVLTTPIQSDGKIIIGGTFTIYNGTGRNFIARLNSNGTLDTGFNPGTGANSVLWPSSIQSDSKIIIGGAFTSYNGTVRNRIARLNSDGSLDTSFNPGIGANSFVYTIAIQGDGKIIIGGEFTSYNGTTRNRIARLLN